MEMIKEKVNKATEDWNNFKVKANEFRMRDLLD